MIGGLMASNNHIHIHLINDNNNYYFQITYKVSQTVLSTFHDVSCLISIKTLGVGWYFYPQFADKETEAQKVKRKEGAGTWPLDILMGS